MVDKIDWIIGELFGLELHHLKIRLSSGEVEYRELSSLLGRLKETYFVKGVEKRWR